MFMHMSVKRHDDDPDLFADMHGAAVVLDVASGGVRAMVSMPDFDLNTVNAHYDTLSRDELNHPLINRATQSMTETGSIIKPVVGIGAITAGVMGVNDTVKCDGYLYCDGKPQPHFRCWTMSKGGFPGHVVPGGDPHPTGLLTFSDALQRSCNVFFETMGDRLDVDGLAHWMRTFGLGRITGVGLPEVRGRLPGFLSEKLVGYTRRTYAWGDAIGQTEVGATPIQMANVAATIARNGIWMRPRLVNDSISAKLRQTATTRPKSDKPTEPIREQSWIDVPDREDLKLMPAAVAEAQDGMFRVVNTYAGTGTLLFNENIKISGKTGTAQAAPFYIDARDAKGKIIYDGKQPKKETITPSLPESVNPLAPWYLGFMDLNPKTKKESLELKHSWYIGFFPSQHPTIAFAVWVEYGGSGGNLAGEIAKKVVDACIADGYAMPDAQAHEMVQ